LFNGAGAFMASDTTDAQGAYSFNALPIGSYTVRVVDGSVVSTRTGGVPGLIPVQTFRTDASSGAAVAVTDHVGGEIPAKADAGNASSTLQEMTPQTITAQSITAVSFGTSAVTGVDFGFSFDVVV